MSQVQSREPVHALTGQVAIASGLAAAAVATRPSIVPRARGANIALAGLSFGVGAGLGALADTGAGFVDRVTPLDRLGVHLLMAGTGAAAAFGLRSAAARSKWIGLAQGAGVVALGAGTLGAALDVTHRVRGADDPHFLNEGTRSALGWTGAALALAGVGLLAKKAVGMAKGAGKLAPGGAQADAAGKALGELVPRSRLGIPGRMFLEGRTTGLATEPVRTYIPLSLDGMTLEQRVARGVESMVRQGAFDRSRIVLVPPTGTGGVNPVPTMMDEVLSEGDTAWVAIQYSNKPSVMSLGKADDGANAIMELARQVAAKRRELFPAGGGPELYASATSLGAGVLHRTLLENADELFDPARIGMRRMLLLGAPEGLTSFTPAALPAGRALRLRTPQDVAAAGADALERAWVLEYAHADDPVRLVTPGLLYQRPTWISGEGARELGFRPSRRFVPGVSALQHVTDVLGSINKGTGEKIGRTMHDYRGDLHGIVRAAFDHRTVDDARLAAAATQVQERAAAQAREARRLILGSK